MAHRRAAARSHGFTRWLAVPAALILDAAAAAYLAGTPFPLGVVVPDGILVAAALVAYGSLAALVFRAETPGTRLAVAAVLLGIHAGLIALHTVGYIALWALPFSAAIRLAHRWSPWIPLLQLVWVPLLALPLLTLVRPGPAPAPRRSASALGRRAAPATRVPVTGLRGRVQPDHEVRVAPGPPEPRPEIPPMGRPAADVDASQAVVVVEAPLEAPPLAEPEPVLVPPAAPVPTAPMVSQVVPPPVQPPAPPPIRDVVVDASAAPLRGPSADSPPRALAPAPVWFDELAEASLLPEASALPDAQTDQERPNGVETAVPPAALSPQPPALPAVPRVVEPGALVLAPPPGPAVAVAPAPPASLDAVLPPPTRDEARARRRAVEPPVDPDVVARLFEPYGPLLSRDRTVLVDWAPGPDAGVLCAAPRGAFRDQVVGLAARLASVLDTVGAPSAPDPVRRLSLRGRDGVVVITPLDGAVLIAAARRRGALALLEVLSARAVPGPISGGHAPREEDAASVIPDAPVSGARRVETETAIVDVLAPDGIEAAPLGELVGRLLDALFAAGEPVQDGLSVDLGAHRLAVHPVHPDARPPRFVVMVGRHERPGLLGRRTERAARALREAS